MGDGKNDDCALPRLLAVGAGCCCGAAAAARDEAGAAIETVEAACGGNVFGASSASRFQFSTVAETLGLLRLPRIVAAESATPVEPFCTALPAAVAMTCGAVDAPSIDMLCAFVVSAEVGAGGGRHRACAADFGVKLARTSAAVRRAASVARVCAFVAARSSEFAGARCPSDPVADEVGASAELPMLRRDTGGAGPEGFRFDCCCIGGAVPEAFRFDCCCCCGAAAGVPLPSLSCSAASEAGTLTCEPFEPVAKGAGCARWGVACDSAGGEAFVAPFAGPAADDDGVCFDDAELSPTRVRNERKKSLVAGGLGRLATWAGEERVLPCVCCNMGGRSLVGDTSGVGGIDLGATGGAARGGTAAAASCVAVWVVPPLEAGRADVGRDP